MFKRTRHRVPKGRARLSPGAEPSQGCLSIVGLPDSWEAEQVCVAALEKVLPFERLAGGD